MLKNTLRIAYLTAALFCTLASAQDLPAPTAPEPGQAVRLTDQELDEVTAGFVIIAIYNPGKHVSEAPRVNEHRAVCINCGGNSSEVFGTVTVVRGNSVRTVCIPGGPKACGF